MLFLARDSRGTLAITRAGARVVLLNRNRKKAIASSEISIQFPGARWTSVRGETQKTSHTNLLLGNDPAKWMHNARHFGQVRISGAYPGIDVVFHSRRGIVEFDFEVSAGANAALARFAFPGRKPVLQSDGSLRVAAEAGDLVLPKPVAYQDGGANVESRFVLRGREARFALGSYDRGKRLVIDPALAYLTYHGGGGNESAYASAVDAAGNIYIAGATTSSNFPATPGVLQATPLGKTDAYISKFNAAGTLVYSTLLGGADNDRIDDIAVDSQGSVYFAGASASGNFPLVNAIQSINKGGGAGFDVIFGKLNPSGAALVYSSFYGGNYDDEALACAIDADGNLYLTGFTISDNFPFTPGAFQTSNRSPIAGNGFVTKIAPAGDKAVFSTFIGGGVNDRFYDIALDKNRNIYLAGDSLSPTFPVLGAYQPTNRGNYDAVLTKLRADGAALAFSTFIGGAQLDTAFGVEVDANDNVFVTGTTMSPTFPTTTGALQKDLSGPSDMFIMKFDATGSILQASTLFGGNREEEPFRMAIDRAGSVYIAGTTASAGIRTVDAVQQTSGGARDAFLLKLSNALDTVQMFTYLGGTNDDFGLTMALDPSGRLIIAGRAVSTDLLTTSNARQKTSSGGTDSFLAVIDTSSAANPFTVSSARLTFSGAAGSTIARQQFNIRAATGQPEWTIDATSTGNWLSASPKNGAGNATIDVSVNVATLAAGNYEGSLSVNNTRLGTKTVIAVILTVNAGGGTVPDNGVVSAATFTGGAVAPGLLVTIFGSNIGPPALTSAQVTPQGTLATTLADTRVLFDNVAAPLVYVSAGQLSAIVPYTVADKATTSMQVEYKGVKSNAIALRITATAPGLFTANSSGKGPGAILNEDASLNTASNPAKAGGIVILYGTGEGVTDPSGQDGQLALNVYPKPRQPVTVRIGGKEAEVLYAGAAPGLVAGVFQINVKVPEGLDAGPQPVVVQIGTASSSPDVTVAVQP
ncbi:MAG: hypothetical protein HYX27_27055 [Acidobacteria bacterium]|nr:hypothetical protein [Acidobacteriota bacterium]